MTNQKSLLRMACLLISAVSALAAGRSITADSYLDKVHGAWVGSVVGQVNGIELQYDSTPAPYDTLFGLMNRGEWVTDDDHSLEWVFLHMMEEHGLDDITYSQMASEWLDHIIRDIWCANAIAYSQMKSGILPPQTGKGSTYIDGQIECEVFGMIAPGMIRNALDREDYWGRVVADRYALDASKFYAALCAEAYFESNAENLVKKVLSYFDQDCLIAQEVNAIIGWHKKYPKWKDARQQLYHSIFYDGAINSACNFGVSIIALLYGNSDWIKSVEIAGLAGWDGDCNASTVGVVLGIMKGYSGLPSSVSAAGTIYRNTSRDNLPLVDSLTGIAARCQVLAEKNILARGGTITGSGAARTYTVVDGRFAPPGIPDTPPTPPPGNLTTKGFIIASAISGFNGGNADIESIRDGKADYPSCYRVNADSSKPVWIGYSYGPVKKFTRLVYQEGYAYFQFGGWFANGTLKVQVRRDGAWFDAASTCTPAYPSSNDPSQFSPFASYTFSLDSVAGDGIRIIGASGGQDLTRTYANIAEIHVWGTDEHPATATNPGIRRGPDCSLQRTELRVLLAGQKAISYGSDAFSPDGRRVSGSVAARRSQSQVLILRSGTK